MLKYPSVMKGELFTPKKVELVVVQETKESGRFAQLSWTEYITMIFIVHFGNLESLVDFLSHNLLLGGVLYTSAFIFFYLIIGLPLTSLNLFLGHFSKCGLFRLWSISPIYKGVGYATVALGLISIIMSSVLTATCFLYMLNLLREEIPWITCTFGNVQKRIRAENCIEWDRLNGTSNDICCPYYTTKHCPSNTMHHPTINLSCLYYYRNEVTKLDSFNDNLTTLYEMKIDLSLCLTVTWILTIIASTIGFNTTKTYIRKMGIFSTITLVICFIITIFQGIPQGDKVMSGVQINLFEDSATILKIISTICLKSLPLSVVCLGACAPASTIPTVDALFTTVMYLGMIFLFALWLTVEIGAVRNLIKVKSIHCISHSGTEVLLALLPDLIVNYLPLAVLFAFLYFLSLFLLGLSAQIIYITAILDSIEDIKPTFRHYRLQFCIILCALSNCIGLLWTTPLQELITESWFLYANHFVVIIAITLYSTAVMWIYGANRIQNDIEFTYKTKLSITFWIICWKCFPFVAVTIFILTALKLKMIYGLISDVFHMKIVCGVLTLLILIPIPISAILHYFQNIRFIAMDNFTTLFKCDQAWGPPDSEIRRARNRFNPKKEIRYKSEKQQCRHNCLIHSKRLMREVERLEANRKLFLEEIKKLKGEDSTVSTASTMSK